MALILYTSVVCFKNKKKYWDYKKIIDILPAFSSYFLFNYKNLKKKKLQEKQPKTKDMWQGNFITDNINFFPILT